MMAAIEICVRTDLSGALWLAAISFLVAIPVLTLAIVMGMIEDDVIGQSLLGTLSYNMIKVVGLLLSLAGFGCLFMSKSGYLGTVYFIVVLVAIAAHRIWWEILAVGSKSESSSPNSTMEADARKSDAHGSP